MIKTLKRLKINRISDVNVFYMKVAQNDETNPNTQHVRPPHIPSIETHNFPPPIHLFENVKHQGYFPGCSPPSPVSPPTVLGHTWHRYLSCHASICICLHCIHCFFPLFSPVDYETDAAAGAPINYVVDDPYLPEQPGKPPFDQPGIAYSFSLLLALE